MNRRGFLELLGMATVGGTVAYSFPSIIVPKNVIVSIESFKPRSNLLKELNLISKKEIFPELIEDLWFTDSPLFARMCGNKSDVEAMIEVASFIN